MSLTLRFGTKSQLIINGLFAGFHFPPPNISLDYLREKDLSISD